MAIDSLRKRASVASLGLAFLGPSVVADGSFIQGDRQTIGHGYYGINVGAGAVELGGTSQLEAFTSSGGITLERVIGGTSQLEAFTSTGGITLERTIGGTSQLAAFTSSGVITVGDAVAEETKGGGKSKQGRHYPRWVVVNGQRYYVNNAEEERRLLRLLQEKTEEAAKIAAALGDETLAKQATKRAVRIEKRQKTVDDREAEWLQRLQDEDEELLVLFG
jgi:hypothetical protein